MSNLFLELYGTPRGAAWFGRAAGTLRPRSAKKSHRNSTFSLQFLACDVVDVQTSAREISLAILERWARGAAGDRGNAIEWAGSSSAIFRPPFLRDLRLPHVIGPSRHSPRTGVTRADGDGARRGALVMGGHDGDPHPPDPRSSDGCTGDSDDVYVPTTHAHARAHARAPPPWHAPRSAAPRR